MSGIAHVYVNDVEVGSLPSEQYEQIVKQSKRNPRLYAKQIINIAWVVYGLAIYAIRTIPWLCFLSFVLAMAFAPTELAQLIDGIKNLSSIELIQSLKSGFSTAYFFTCVVCGCAAGISSRFAQLGYKSYFGEAISLQIRKILEVPTDGKMTVTFITMKDAISPEEK